MCGKLLQSFFRLPWLGTAQGYPVLQPKAQCWAQTAGAEVALPVALRLACLDIEEFMVTDLNCQLLGDSILLDSNLQTCEAFGKPGLMFRTPG